MTISIVTPFHNAARYLAESIESVRLQTRGDWELLLVDDASTDASPLIAEGLGVRDARIRIVSLPRQLGPAAARNAGIATAQDGWLTFHDADDVMPPDRLANQVGYLVPPGYRVFYKAYFRNDWSVPIRGAMPLLETVMLDDVTITWQPATGPRILSWKE